MDFRYYINKFIRYYYLDNSLDDDPTLTFLEKKPKKNIFAKAFRSVIKSATPFAPILKNLNAIVEVVMTMKSLITAIFKNVTKWFNNPHLFIEMLVQLVILFFMMIVSIIGNAPYRGSYKVKHFVLYSILLVMFIGIHFFNSYGTTIIMYVGMLFVLWGLDKVTKGAVSTFYYKNLPFLLGNLRFLLRNLSFNTRILSFNTRNLSFLLRNLRFLLRNLRF